MVSSRCGLGRTYASGQRGTRPGLSRVGGAEPHLVMGEPQGNSERPIKNKSAAFAAFLPSAIAQGCLESVGQSPTS
jgi:hypothetical protein